MANFRYSMLFSYVSGDGTGNVPAITAGWSESVYYGSYSDAKNVDFRVLAQRRAAILPTSGAVIGLRIQAVDPSGSAQSFSVNYPGSYAADIPQMALLLRCGASGVTNVRSMRLAAIPDSQVEYGQFRPTSGFKSDLLAYIKELSNWYMRGCDLNQAKYNLTSIGADGSYILSQAYSPAINSLVRIRGLKDSDDDSTPGGVFRVNSVSSPTAGRLEGWKHDATVLMGNLSPYVPILAKINADESSISRVVTRKVGRSFLQYHGRKSSHV